MTSESIAAEASEGGVGTCEELPDEAEGARTAGAPYATVGCLSSSGDGARLGIAPQGSENSEPTLNTKLELLQEAQSCSPAVGNRFATMTKVYNAET